MADFKALIQLISTAVDKFNSNIPGIQKKMLDDILLLTKQLNTKDDKIKIAAENLKLLSQVKSRLQKVLLNPEYVKSVRGYLGNFDEVVNLQNEYFRSVENKFSPPKLTTQIKKQAIGSVVGSLTETGLNANIVDKVHDLMRKAATSGGSYNSLNKQLTDFITNNESGEGQLLRYTKQITTDALNQFSGQYTQLISADLGFEWFRYSGSNIETSRPFCLACTDRKYFHISELPKVLLGEFEEFRKYDGKINKKTGLPEGMIPGTDVSNFQINRGGYNCGHQWRPVSVDLVPLDIQQRVFATPEYAAWARANGKKVKDLPKPKKVIVPPIKPKVTNSDKIDLSNHPEINNIYDVKQILTDNNDAIKDLFHNTTFKSLGITHVENRNGSTDMNGNIKLSSEKARLVSEALKNIQKATTSSLEQEMAMATLWHEIWHNSNKANTTNLTTTETRYMELGNEFVARKTLDQIFEKFGGKLSNTSLKENRTDTLYNSWVRNFDHLIKYFDADAAKVLSHMTDKMRNGNYDEVKSYLIESLKAGNPSAKEAEIRRGVQDAIRLSEKEFAADYEITH